MKFSSIKEFIDWVNTDSKRITEGIKEITVEYELDDEHETLVIDEHENIAIDEPHILTAETTSFTFDPTLASPTTIPVPEVEVLSFDMDTDKIKIVPSIVEGDNSNKENVWYVDAYESIPDTCMTGKVEYNDNQYYMNVCESNGASVELTVKVDNVPKKIKFALDTCNTCSDHDMILYVK